MLYPEDILIQFMKMVFENIEYPHEYLNVKLQL